MARAPLALAIETPIWSGSPQGVLCFPPSTGSFERKSSKRWSSYLRRGADPKRKDKSNHQVVREASRQQLTSEPDDITDRLRVRRKWATNEASRPVNVFEGESSPSQLWKEEAPLDPRVDMFSWKGVHCPDVPDSRLVKEPSVSTRTSLMPESGFTLSNRANSLEFTSRELTSGATTAAAAQTLKRQTSLRKVDVPKLIKDVPSLEQVKALLREEAKKLPKPLKLVPIGPLRNEPKAGFAKFLSRFSSRRCLEQRKTISAPIVESVRAPQRPSITRNLSLGSMDRRIKPPIPPKPQFWRNSLSSSSGDSHSTTSSLASDQTVIDEDRSVDIRCDLDDVLIMDLLKTLDLDERERVKLARREPPVEENPLSELDAAMEKDQEILGQWLRSIHFEEYIALFVNSGYDMPTISRMTPEDLTAIGITKPTHRRKLFTEISKLNISDGIPDYKPESLSLMLKLLRLEEYETTLVSQGYDSVDKVAELAWEDIDDIGIRKLGHQKKLTLAIRKIKNFSRFQPAFRPIPPVSSSSHQSLARHSSIDLGNPHARPITVPVPPDQFDQQWKMMPLLQQPVPQSDALTYPHLRQVSSGSDLHKQDLEEQVYFAWQQQADNMCAEQQALRGRSLESLEQSFEWYDMVNSWRTQMMPDQGQFIEGTSTLNRPRGLIKARPVAKVQGTSTVSIRDQLSLDSEDISKPDLLPGQVPIPPKRLMSSSVVKAHDVGDTAFATCVQSLTSRFALDTREDQLDDIADEPALALQLSSPNQIPIPLPPEPPPTPTKPSALQRDRSPIPSGDNSQVAPQMIELNHAIQSELKLKLKQRNYQAAGSFTGAANSSQVVAAAAPLKSSQNRPKQVSMNKSDPDLEREKFLAKLESVRKKSERKEDAKTGGRKTAIKTTEHQASRSDANDVGRSFQGHSETLKQNNVNINDANQDQHAQHNNSASIDKEIRSLQECTQASAMDPAQSKPTLEDDASDYDTNPFTALLSKIEKSVDKEFLERKRNEKAAATDVTVAALTPETNPIRMPTSTAMQPQASAFMPAATTTPSSSSSSLLKSSSSTTTTTTATATTAVVTGAATSSSSNKGKFERIKSIEVKLEASFGPGINNLNKERPYEIARSTKAEPIIRNKFFSTIGVETKVINLEDRPHRKSDAGLPPARGNTVGDNQRRTSLSEVSGASNQSQANRLVNEKTSVLDAAQLQAAQAEFDNKFGNLNVSKESEKDKKIMEIQEALVEQREGLVSSARKIFEVCAKTSASNSANSTPTVPRRNSTKKDAKEEPTAGPPLPPVLHPRSRTPPDVPPRNPRNAEEQKRPPVPLRLPAKNPHRVPETPKVIQDIEHMLSSLTDQLDAMLD